MGGVGLALLCEPFTASPSPHSCPGSRRCFWKSSASSHPDQRSPCVLSTGYLPNSAHALEAMLAAASIGAIWSSTSPDFGVNVSRGPLKCPGCAAPAGIIPCDFCLISWVRMWAAAGWDQQDGEENSFTMTSRLPSQ